MAGITVLASTGVASASIFELQLSNVSSEIPSEPDSPTPADVLDATFEFMVVGNTLTLSVTNDTMAPDEYNINEVYFNADDRVSDMTFTSNNAGWSFVTNVMVNGFGFFDFGLQDGVGGDENNIMPGETVVFTFDFTGIADAKNFTTATTELGFLIAGKFVNGPNDDSAFGGNRVPAPGVLALLGMAGLVGLRRRRRRD